MSLYRFPAYGPGVIPAGYITATANSVAESAPVGYNGAANQFKIPYPGRVIRAIGKTIYEKTDTTARNIDNDIAENVFNNVHNTAEIQHITTPAGSFITPMPVAYMEPTAGTHHIWITTVATPTGQTLHANAAFPAFLLLEDLGPA